MAVGTEGQRSAVGRPSGLTAGVQAAIVAAVRSGMPISRAGLAMGIEETTVNEWMQRGEGRHPRRPSTPEYAAFASEVRKAEADNEAEKLAVITKAGQGGIVLSKRTITFRDGRVVEEETLSKPEWQAAAWYLERTKPDTYAKRERMDLRQMMHEVTRRVAEEQGLKVDEVLAEAQRLVAEKE